MTDNTLTSKKFILLTKEDDNTTRFGDWKECQNIKEFKNFMQSQCPQPGKLEYTAFFVAKVWLYKFNGIIFLSLLLYVFHHGFYYLLWKLNQRKLIVDNDATLQYLNSTVKVISNIL